MRPFEEPSFLSLSSEPVLLSPSDLLLEFPESLSLPESGFPAFLLLSFLELLLFEPLSSLELLGPELPELLLLSLPELLLSFELFELSLLPESLELPEFPDELLEEDDGDSSVVR